MALGGVATGIMKAQVADKVAGIISMSGLIFAATAIEASRGRIISVVAILDVSSVRKVSVVQMTATMLSSDVPSNPPNPDPTYSDRPDV